MGHGRGIGLIGKRGAIQAVMTVMTILFGIIFMTLVISWFTETENCEVMKTTCSSQQLGYCLDWWKADRSLQTGKPIPFDLKTCVDGDTDQTCEPPDDTICLELLRGVV